jgi:hypothetical protein
MKNKKRLLKNLACGAVGLAILGGTYIKISNSNDKNYLKPEDFSKAKWIERDNLSGIIWDKYMDEKIPKNQFNWHLYIDEVREKNKGSLEGKIWLPDLDDDGEVGK